MAKGRISSKEACFIGTGLTVSSLAAFHAFQPFTWVISNSIWFSYLTIYLPMKQKSEYNTLVGAIVGAMPPFIGTFAQTGTLLDPTTWLLASYIFTWQFPHFYGILYEHKDDYKKAGFVMTSNDDPTGEKTAFKQILDAMRPILGVETDEQPKDVMENKAARWHVLSDRGDLMLFSERQGGHRTSSLQGTGESGEHN